MSIKLVLLVALLIFILQPQQHIQYETEQFLGEYNSFNPNNKNDYYVDRTGRKGVLFRKLLDNPIYELPNEVVENTTINDFRDIVGLYSMSFYDKPGGTPPVIVLPETTNAPDYINDRLNFNQGVLYSS